MSFASMTPAMAGGAGSSGADMAGMVGLGAQALGGALSVFGTYQAKQAEQEAYQAQARVAEQNAAIERFKAQDAEQRGQAEVARHQLKVAGLKGTQRATLAARGIDVGEGSALEILTDTDLLAAVDIGTIIDNHAKEAWAYRTQADNFTANASLLSKRAASTSPALSAFGTFLNGAGTVASSWYSMSEKGFKFPSFGRPSGGGGSSSGGSLNYGAGANAYGYGPV
jgi:hypothetical protein